MSYYYSDVILAARIQRRREKPFTSFLRIFYFLKHLCDVAVIHHQYDRRCGIIAFGLFCLVFFFFDHVSSHYTGCRKYAPFALGCDSVEKFCYINLIRAL